MRLIDADAVDYENIMCSLMQLEWLNAIIESQPAIDAVPVIRCKECVFCSVYETNGSYHCRSHNGMHREVMPDEFCSYGEGETE